MLVRLSLCACCVCGCCVCGCVGAGVCVCVCVCVCGHDHNLQWLEPVEECDPGMSFILSGAGAKLERLQLRTWLFVLGGGACACGCGCGYRVCWV